MNVVSYAQNQEDIMLFRALRDVERGFYIDVGAQQPVVDSVTKLFYERGWTGINIDPMPQWYEMLTADRPHDINLQLALSEKRGRMAFFAIPDTGLSTADPEFVRKHEQAGYAAQEIDVEVRTLDDVCAEHGVDVVHFLKIDVEGAEEGVIRGFSFDRIRPWIVVVEAVEPVAQREGDGAKEAVSTHASWEPLLLAHGYVFVYWDGLNRFYVAKEHGDLQARFDAPPNPLDAFIRYNDLAKHERILQLEAERRGLVDAASVEEARRRIGDVQGLFETAENRLRRIAELEQENARLVGRAAALEEERAAVYSVFAAALEEQRAATQSISEVVKQQLDSTGGVQQERDHFRSESSQLRRDIGRQAQEIARRDDQLARCHEELARCHVDMQAILLSRSWRLTKPLRWITRNIGGQSSQVAGSDSGSGKSIFRRAVRRLLFAGARFVRRHDGARRQLDRLLHRAPSLHNKLAAFNRHNAQFIHPDAPPPAQPTSSDMAHTDQPPGVQAIHARLRSAASSRNSNNLD